MGCGMVRKVDELGRVVIPKEMRRVLNIKTGSSIEMFIDDDNHVVLKKFSELSNIENFAEAFSDILYEKLNVSCLICDDEKVVVCRGLNKKDFVSKQLKFGANGLFEGNEQCYSFCEIVDGQNVKFEFNYIFKIVNEGFVSGYVIVLSKEELNSQVLQKVDILSKFLASLIKF